MQCHLGSAERPTAALSNPHLSSKAAKRRASRMFSSGSQVLYLYHKNEGGGGGCEFVDIKRLDHMSKRTHARCNTFLKNNLSACSAITDYVADSDAR